MCVCSAVCAGVCAYARDILYCCCYRNVGPPHAITVFCGVSSYYEYDGKKPLLCLDNPVDDVTLPPISASNFGIVIATFTTGLAK